MESQIGIGSVVTSSREGKEKIIMWENNAT